MRTATRPFELLYTCYIGQTARTFIVYISLMFHRVGFDVKTKLRYLIGFSVSSVLNVVLSWLLHNLAYVAHVFEDMLPILFRVCVKIFLI